MNESVTLLLPVADACRFVTVLGFVTGGAGAASYIVGRAINVPT